MQKILFILITVLFLFSCSNNKKPVSKIAKNEVNIDHLDAMKTIKFPSKDGLIITADLYEIANAKNFILLCHQANFSRGEYKDTALKLNSLGYSCMAIDQRSGKIANDIINETAKRAKEKGLATKYLDAKPDIDTAIDYVYKLNNNKTIILVGSSYSASLALLIGSENKKIKAVASFSPGEYLKGINLTESIKNITIPVFVTSSKKEIEQTASVTKFVKSKLHFKPEVIGIHGSRALWGTTKGNESYWESFTVFLEGLN